MKRDEHRAITAAGPDVLFVRRADMLSMLDEIQLLKDTALGDRFLFAGIGFAVAIGLVLLKGWIGA